MSTNRAKSSGSNRPSSRGASTGRQSSFKAPSSNQEKRQIVGQYMIGKTIGEGTFGKVKLAVHIPTGEKVAIKILEKARIKEQADVRRVNREIKILKKARHSNIIQLYEVLDTQNNIYLIMECAEGGEMFDYIVAQKHVAEIQACKFFHQIIDGVELLHNNEITHRDLKPENLLLKASPDGWLVKIVDFGLSNTHEGGRLLVTACGSPCYAAPEMIAGKKYVGPLADLWSIGVILFALVCGYLPFEDPNTSALYKKILSGDYKAPKWISAEVRDLIRCILEVDPRKRYTVADIRKHPWYNLVSEAQVPREKINVYENEQTRAETLAALTEAGLDTQAVMDGVVSHACNSLTAMYYLLEQKHRAIRSRQPSIVRPPPTLGSVATPRDVTPREAPAAVAGNSTDASATDPQSTPRSAAPASNPLSPTSASANPNGSASAKPVLVKPNLLPPTQVAPYLQTPSIMQQYLSNNPKTSAQASLIPPIKDAAKAPTAPAQPVSAAANGNSIAMPNLEYYMKNGLNLSTAVPVAGAVLPQDAPASSSAAAATATGADKAPVTIPKLKLPAGQSSPTNRSHKAPGGYMVPALTSQTARQPAEVPGATITLPNSARAVLISDASPHIITTMNNQPVESDIPVRISEELRNLMSAGGEGVEAVGERPNTRRSHSRQQSRGGDVDLREAMGSLNLDGQGVGGGGAPAAAVAQQASGNAPNGLKAAAPDLPPRASSSHGGRRGKNLAGISNAPAPPAGAAPTQPAALVAAPPSSIAPSSGSGKNASAANPRAQALKNKLAQQGTSLH